MRIDSLVVPDLLRLPVIVRFVALHGELRPLVCEAESLEQVVDVGAADLDPSVGEVRAMSRTAHLPFRNPNACGSCLSSWSILFSAGFLFIAGLPEDFVAL